MELHSKDEKLIQGMIALDKKRRLLIICGIAVIIGGAGEIGQTFLSAMPVGTIWNGLWMCAFGSFLIAYLRQNQHSLRIICTLRQEVPKSQEDSQRET